MSGSNNNDANNGSRSPKGLSRRRFLTGSTAAAAGVLLASKTDRAEAFFNVGAFWKRPSQTTSGYVIEQSARFRQNAPTFLTRSPVAGNDKTFTFSTWFKLSSWELTVNANLWATWTGGADQSWIDINNNRISMGLYGGNYTILSDALVRDTSAWYHLCVVVDTTQATPSNRMKMYLNGNLLSVNGAIYPSQNYSCGVNAAGVSPGIGIRTYGSYRPFDGYMADTNFADGLALNPTNFGKVDGNGVWVPIAPTVASYGNNGYRLEYKNSANFGLDTSGRGNHWTPSGFQAYDQVLDSPTNNFCTWNPVANGWHQPTLTFGNLNSYATTSNAASDSATTFSSFVLDVGKWYWEVTDNYGASHACSIGIGLFPPTSAQAPSTCCFYKNWVGHFFLNGSMVQSGVSTTNSGDVIGLALDLDSRTLAYYKNGVQLGTTVTGLTAGSYAVMVFQPSSTDIYSVNANFGQGGQTGLVYDNASGGRFKYTPPAGFKALSTVNLQSNMPVVTSGTFPGNANADGPFVWLGGAPTDLTINGNAVTWGTHADKLANGFKIRTSSASYNASGSNSFSATVPAKFKWATARANP